MSGIPGISDGPQAPEPQSQGPPTTQVTEGPRFDRPPERPKDGPSTFLVAKTETCQFCQKAMGFLKALHEERGDFQVAVLDAQAQRDAFQQIAGHTRRSTVPQIFLDGRFVGGWDELAAAARKGKLDAYLDGESWQADPAPKRGLLRRLLGDREKQNA